MLELVLEGSSQTPDNNNSANQNNRYVHGFNRQAFLDTLTPEEYRSASRMQSQINVDD